MLIGGGELHERFHSLVRTERPLSRGIQRFTGITQAMVDRAPPPSEVLDDLRALVSGRVLVAHSARFDTRPGSGIRARGARLAEPARPLHGRARSSLRAARPAAGACATGGRARHRGPRGTPGAAGCAHLRVFCALFPKLCANAATVAEAVDLMRSRRRVRSTPAAERIPPEQRPDLSTLPDDPGVYIFRDERGRPLYVGKSVSLRSRARAHFCAPAGWTERAEIVDYRPTNSSWALWCSRTG